MDKNVLKKFAIESRQELMEKVANKINRYFVDEEFNVSQNGEVYVLVNDKHILRLTKNEYENRQLLVKRIKEITLEQVIEEAAYTWFNRIIAIRYMEIHDYLPLTKENQSLGVRVLSSKDNTPDPEIMKISNLINPDLDIDFNKEYYGSIQDNNKRFEYVLLLVCKKLGKVIPQVFDGITDYIDILIPDNLLNESGYVTKLLKDVSLDNFEQVEIIGWLYQYYNQTEKDRVISMRKAYKKNEVAYATQLFTPDWIVRYMVENSLGRYWIEHSRNNDNHSSIVDNWKYYVKEQIENKQEERKPTEITFIDPCCGSGHILVYAFEVFYQIYLASGYNKNEIPELILTNNLFGLDVDDRAGQLSILSIILKAREYDKNIFNKEIIKELNIVSIQESNNIGDNLIENINDIKQREIAKYLKTTFYNAKEVGALLIVESQNYSELKNSIIEDDTIFGIELREKYMPIIKSASLLSKKYDIVVTNPPYLNTSVMSPILKKYVGKNFADVKYDLFSTFIKRNSFLCKNNSYLGFMTPNVWMFISSYEDLRKYIINNMNINSLVQLSKGSFFKEATVDIVTFIIKKTDSDNEYGTYYRLEKYGGNMESQREGFLNALQQKDENVIFRINKNDLRNIPGYNIAFWCSKKLLEAFKNGKLLGSIADIVTGMSTGDNNSYLRLWYEININKIAFNKKNLEDIDLQKTNWIPYNKGGEARKWYGNNEYVVKWSENAHFHRPRYTFKELYLKPGITWSFVTTGMFSARYYKDGFLWDVAGSPCVINNKKLLYYVLGFLSTKIARNILSFINPTINCQVVDMQRLPIIIDEEKIEEVSEIVEKCIELSNEDWDSFETSWDFIEHPLIKYKSKENNKLINDYKMLESDWDKKFKLLKKYEEELNEIFIDIYDLKNEMLPDINDKEVTIKRANALREVKSLISYAVGCMFGRYTLDKSGLIYAGGEFNKDNYKSFEADVDNIIPLTEDSYFGDDMVSRFRKFIEKVYGQDTVYDNLDFIADTLGKRNGENSEETIRRYFINDFYNDHVKMYQKRPIYWLFDSGKKNGFKCLIYMHRYNEGLVSKIRLDYLHRMQNTYEKELKEISDKLNNDIDLASKRDLSKRQADLSSKLQETNEYDEKIAHIADQKIKIDLDDGVIVNYAKFCVKNPKTGKEESILAKIK